MVDTKNKWNYIKDREEIKTLMRLSFRFVESSNFFYFCVSPLMILERRAFLPSLSTLKNVDNCHKMIILP